jgi:hypothetical protein
VRDIEDLLTALRASVSAGSGRSDASAVSPTPSRARTEPCERPIDCLRGWTTSSPDPTPRRRCRPPRGARPVDLRLNERKRDRPDRRLPTALGPRVGAPLKDSGRATWAKLARR